MILTNNSAELVVVATIKVARRSSRRRTKNFKKRERNDMVSKRHMRRKL
jgi:hypothetical protein